MAEEVTYADLTFINLEQHKKEGFQKTKTKGSPDFTNMDEYSTNQPLASGVSQDSVLSPMLFNMCLNPLGEVVFSFGFGVTTSHHWQPAAVALGIFCLALLGAAGTLGFKVLQASHRVSSQNENLTLQKKMLEILLTKLNILQGQNLNLSETVQQLSNYRGHRCSPCPEKWLQRGENCYFFTTKWNSWEEGKTQCTTLNSRLLKIENKEELEFILESAPSYNSYWIGLSRRRASEPWLWEDNSTFIMDLFNIPDAGSSNYPICVSIQGGNLVASDCLGYRFSICEKIQS